MSSIVISDMYYILLHSKCSQCAKYKKLAKEKRFNLRCINKILLNHAFLWGLEASNKAIKGSGFCYTLDSSIVVTDKNKCEWGRKQETGI